MRASLQWYSLSRKMSANLGQKTKPNIDAIIHAVELWYCHNGMTSHFEASPGLNVKQVTENLRYQLSKTSLPESKLEILPLAVEVCRTLFKYNVSVLYSEVTKRQRPFHW